MSLSRASVLIMCDAADRMDARAAQIPQPKHKPDSVSSKLQCRTWNLLRIRPKTSLQELIDTLLDADQSTAEKTSARGTLQKYLRALQQAGYLVDLQRTAKGKRFALIRNTGPFAPIVQARHHKVYDQNEKKHYDIQK